MEASTDGADEDICPAGAAVGDGMSLSTTGYVLPTAAAAAVDTRTALAGNLSLWAAVALAGGSTT
jgi:hypothetical protein